MHFRWKEIIAILFHIFLMFLFKKTNKMSYPVQKPESEWKTILNSKEYNVIRKKGTEPPFKGEYDNFYPTEGYFQCRACHNPLYSTKAKFKSGCGWPAFDMCYRGSVAVEVDESLYTKRTEILCANCGGHLGHVFNEGRHSGSRTSERHCVNSLSVRYVAGQPPADTKPEDTVVP
eukprot:Lankesteria_metandrocarpae@DN811_c0_g1_i1.p1